MICLCVRSLKKRRSKLIEMFNDVLHLQVKALIKSRRNMIRLTKRSHDVKENISRRSSFGNAPTKKHIIRRRKKNNDIS